MTPKAYHTLFEALWTFANAMSAQTRGRFARLMHALNYELDITF
jgi:hypothetical protein